MFAMVKLWLSGSTLRNTQTVVTLQSIRPRCDALYALRFLPSLPSYKVTLVKVPQVRRSIVKNANRANREDPESGSKVDFTLGLISRWCKCTCNNHVGRRWSLGHGYYLNEHSHLTPSHVSECNIQGGTWHI